MLTTQMPYECAAQTLWCAAASFSSALAFCTGFSCKFLPLSVGLQPLSDLFSTAPTASYIIYTTACASGARLAVNVAQADGCKWEVGQGFDGDR